jgi:hypothetical protein
VTVFFRFDISTPTKISRDTPEISTFPRNIFAFLLFLGNFGRAVTSDNDQIPTSTEGFVTGGDCRFEWNTLPSSNAHFQCHLKRAQKFTKLGCISDALKAEQSDQSRCKQIPRLLACLSAELIFVRHYCYWCTPKQCTNSRMPHKYEHSQKAC